MDFDIAIIGAGPAGATCLLGLAGKGLRVLVIEKATFPREKACGDAVPGLALKVWEEMAPELVQRLHALPSANPLADGFVCGPYGGKCKVTFSRPGLVVKRLEMDEAVFAYAREQTKCTVVTAALNRIQPTENGFWLQTEDGRSFTAFRIAGADGVNGICRKSLMQMSWAPEETSVAVRAYLKPKNAGVGAKALSLWFDKSIIPGYFWAFPLADGTLNVGAGILSTRVKAGIDLKGMLRDWLAMQEADDERPTGQPDSTTWLGQRLPLARDGRYLVGKGWALLGDAGGLVSPATGDGIGQAAASGELAAAALAGSLLVDRGMSQNILVDQYVRPFYKRFGRSFRDQWLVLNLGHRHPKFLNGLIRFAAWFPPFGRFLSGL